ncbi:MAG: BlaI/MecI/CopY family transcriptional regulator [Planctomycetes bacterium]|nr:BlaI/MecI/CopY family transcriptional regulator [Planctomycetota bacterium]
MNKCDLRALSGAETEIMVILWELERGSVQDVCGRLPEGRSIAYATVQTLLRRLEKKGYIGHDVVGKAHVFYPVAERDEVVGSALGVFVDKLFDGSCAGLAQYLAEHGKIDADDIDKLRDITGK